MIQTDWSLFNSKSCLFLGTDLVLVTLNKHLHGFFIAFFKVRETFHALHPSHQAGKGVVILVKCSIQEKNCRDGKKI